jgi:hypothetical protein
MYSLYFDSYQGDSGHDGGGGKTALKLCEMKNLHVNS